MTGRHRRTGCSSAGERVEAGDGTYDIVNPATEEVVGRGARTPRWPTPRRPARRPRPRFPAWSRTTPEERAALLHEGRRPARRRERRARPARAGRDRRHHAGRQDDAGAAGRGPLPPLRPGRVEPRSRCRRPSCRPPRWRPAGSSAPSSTARRSASSPASPPTTSRSPTWPARSPRPWPWATPSW